MFICLFHVKQTWVIRSKSKDTYHNDIHHMLHVVVILVMVNIAACSWRLSPGPLSVVEWGLKNKIIIFFIILLCTKQHWIRQQAFPIQNFSISSWFLINILYKSGISTNNTFNAFLKFTWFLKSKFRQLKSGFQSQVVHVSSIYKKRMENF